MFTVPFKREANIIKFEMKVKFFFYSFLQKKYFSYYKTKYL